MAKFDEADPRWIVKERADGANVNNWHWTEKDCLEWARQRLKQLVTGIELVKEPEIVATVTGVDSVEGECFLNNRKNKLVASYELEVKLSWQGHVLASKDEDLVKASGKVVMPYISDENHGEDPETRVVCDSEDKASQRIKEAIFSKGRQALYDVIHKLVAELRAGGPQTSESAEPGSASSAVSTSKAKLSSADVAQKPQPVNKKSLGTLDFKESFYASPADLYDVFTNENRIKGFSQSPAQVTPEVGGKFMWFGGAVVGEFVELVPHSKIVMRWRFSSWDDDCYSNVAIQLEEPERGTTILVLHQEGIPEADKFGNEEVMGVTERGWQEQVFRRIRVVFGYGI